MKKVLFTICLCTCLLLTGCGDKKTSASIEEARKGNSVSCITNKKLNYFDVEALKEQEAGTFSEDARNIEISFGKDYQKVIEERDRKRAIDAGTYTQEYIYEFNKEGTRVEKVYLVITSNFTHEEVTDSMLKANKDYLDNYYKDRKEYKSYKITIDGKKVIREFTLNIDDVADKSKLNISKQDLILMRTVSDRNGESTVCREN